MAMSIRGAERSEGIARRAEQAVQRCTAERRKPFGGNLAEGDPIVLGAKPNLFKLFSNDVGLLAAQYMNGIQLDILNGVKSINFGAIYENAVAQELKAHGIDPLYYNSPRHGELDFVVEQGGKVVPVEVKSGKHYQRHHALAHVMSVPEYGIETAIVFNDNTLAVKDNILYAPVYMSMFLSPPQLPDKMIYEI